MIDYLTPTYSIKLVIQEEYLQREQTLNTQKHLNTSISNSGKIFVFTIPIVYILQFRFKCE